MRCLVLLSEGHGMQPNLQTGLFGMFRVEWSFVTVATNYFTGLQNKSKLPHT